MVDGGRAIIIIVSRRVDDHSELAVAKGDWALSSAGVCALFPPRKTIGRGDYQAGAVAAADSEKAALAKRNATKRQRARDRRPRSARRDRGFNIHAGPIRSVGRSKHRPNRPDPFRPHDK